MTAPAEPKPCCLLPTLHGVLMGTVPPRLQPPPAAAQHPLSHPGSLLALSELNAKSPLEELIKESVN